jgi:hypothetical protein
VIRLQAQLIRFPRTVSGLHLAATKQKPEPMPLVMLAAQTLGPVCLSSSPFVFNFMRSLHECINHLQAQCLLYAPRALTSRTPHLTCLFFVGYFTLLENRAPRRIFGPKGN